MLNRGVQTRALMLLLGQKHCWVMLVDVAATSRSTVVDVSRLGSSDGLDVERTRNIN
jgi:hypothetical protein